MIPALELLLFSSGAFFGRSGKSSDHLQQLEEVRGWPQVKPHSTPHSKPQWERRLSASSRTPFLLPTRAWVEKCFDGKPAHGQCFHGESPEGKPHAPAQGPVSFLGTRRSSGRPRPPDWAARLCRRSETRASLRTPFRLSAFPSRGRPVSRRQTRSSLWADVFLQSGVSPTPVVSEPPTSYPPYAAQYSTSCLLPRFAFPPPTFSRRLPFLPCGLSCCRPSSPSPAALLVIIPSSPPLSSKRRQSRQSPTVDLPSSGLV